MVDYKLIDKLKGYVNKIDITALPEGHLVSPSQNVLSTDDGTIAVRKGYTLDGPANAALTPIQSSYDWNTSTGTEQNLRFYNGTLEYRYVDSASVVTWRTLMTGLTATAVVRFAEFWNTTEKEDILLFLDATANIYEWSGLVTTISSVGTNTLTKAGTATWAATRALTAGTRKVTINGVDYTYTGGETTTTLTGVTPDPALAAPAIASGDIVHQTVRTNAFSGFTRPAAFASSDVMDLIAILNNQVYLGYTKSRYVFVSKQNSFTDYTASATRTPGQGVTITLDGATVGFAAQEDAMYMSAGKDYWYQVTYQKSADLTAETEVIKRLKTGPRQAAQSQELITKIGNEIIFVSNEPALMSLGRVENVETPQTRNISDEIKTDFDAYDFTNGSLKYFRTLLHVCLPNEGKIHPRNVKYGFWEAPQILPGRSLAIIGGALYMHSSAVPETYVLFSGYNDNTNPIAAKAYFSYQNFGNRANYKNFNEFFNEGYISSNTTATLVLKYDFGGFRTIKNFDIVGNNNAILFQTISDNSLGKYPLGQQPIGSITDSVDNTSKFRTIFKTARDNFFEIQVGYETNDVDQQFKILTFGPNVVFSDSQPNSIKQ